MFVFVCVFYFYFFIFDGVVAVNKRCEYQRWGPVRVYNRSIRITIIIYQPIKAKCTDQMDTLIGTQVLNVVVGCFQNDALSLWVMGVN